MLINESTWLFYSLHSFYHGCSCILNIDIARLSYQLSFLSLFSQPPSLSSPVLRVSNNIPSLLCRVTRVPITTMSPSILFADLSNHCDRPASIHFQRIDLCSGRHADTSPNVLGFYTVYEGPSSSSLTEHHYFCDDKHHKAFSKGKKAALRVVHLLNGNPQTIYELLEVATNIGTETSFLHTGNVALVGHLSSKGHTSDLEVVTSFQKMTFHFSCPLDNLQIGACTSTQLLHFSCPSLNTKEVLFAGHGIPLFDRVDILSGMCLFSAEIMRGSVMEDGHVDVRKLLYANPTLYEMEYIARSSSAIADVAATIILRSTALEQRAHHEFSLPVSITLDVPSFHYYQLIDDKLEQGLCSASEAIAWIEAVEQRYDQVARVFENAVRYELGRRGISPTQDCEIRVSPRTNLVASSIHRALKDLRNPCLNNILHELGNQKDGVWQDFYKLVPSHEQPQDFRALGYLFYIFQVVRPALMKNPMHSSLVNSSGSDSSGPSSRLQSLLISVDDSAERRIYSRAQKFLKKIRNSPESLTNPTLVEMYMIQRVFINGNESGSNLYLDDPTSKSRAILHVIDHEGNAEGGSSSALVEPVDVVRILYGYECAKNIQTWFTEVGL